MDPMSVETAYDLHGAALRAYHRGDRSSTLICYDDGRRDDVPASFWFRDTLDPLEQLGLELCRGKVLDVGAGTGLHALLLQDRGLEVTAIDVAADCIAIMKERGVRHAVLADLYTFRAGPFDSIICLCNGLDKVGSFSRLPAFLGRMRSLLAPNGQLIVDSNDLRTGADSERAAEMQRKSAAGRYIGEMDIVFEFDGQRSAEFTVLQIDSETLSEVALQNGWSCQIVSHRGGHYLARLCPRS
jgi:SAM-dependent methyltransferase